MGVNGGYKLLMSDVGKLMVTGQKGLYTAESISALLTK